MRFLLALPFVTLPTLIKFSRLYYKCDESLDERPDPSRLERQRNHRVRDELSTHCLADGDPCHAPLCADEESVLRIIQRGIAVTTHLLASLFRAPQVRAKTAMALERLRQMEASFLELSVQRGGKLRDEASSPSPGLLTTPSRLSFLDESAPFILANGLLRASNLLQSIRLSSLWS